MVVNKKHLVVQYGMVRDASHSVEQRRAMMHSSVPQTHLDSDYKINLDLMHGASFTDNKLKEFNSTMDYSSIKNFSGQRNNIFASASQELRSQSVEQNSSKSI